MPGAPIKNDARVRLRLQDIRSAIDRVDRHVAGLHLPAYQADVDRQWLVERGVMIVSEAVRHIPQAMTDKYPAIRRTDIRQIGNRIRHEYDKLMPAIMWSIATEHLKELRPVIEAMIQSIDENAQSP